jgi:hypothetical protein
MVSKTNLAIRNKYIDLDLEDCVLPLYLSKRFFQSLANNQLPNMLFKGALWEPKTIVANALAKKINATLLALEFNEEPKTKGIKKGERTLTILRLMLKKYTAAGEKKVFIIESLKHLPKTRYAELFEIIQAEEFHRFIFYSADNKTLLEHIKYLPHISFDFKINHSPEEEEAYWAQCQQLMVKHNRFLSLTDLKLIIKSTYFFWVSLFGRETLQSLRKELQFVALNPEKTPIRLNPIKNPVRLNPINSPIIGR